MIAIKKDLTIKRGNDFNQLFEFQQNNGSAMTLVDWTLKSEIREKKDRNSTLVIAFTVYIPTPSNGKIYLKLTDTETAELNRGRKFYDVLLISPSGFDDTYIEGTATIVGTVTKKV